MLIFRIESSRQRWPIDAIGGNFGASAEESDMISFPNFIFQILHRELACSDWHFHSQKRENGIQHAGNDFLFQFCASKAVS